MHSGPASWASHDRALFASRVATPIGWRGGGYFYNEANGAQGFFFNPRYRVIAAGPGLGRDPRWDRGSGPARSSTSRVSAGCT